MPHASNDRIATRALRLQGFAQLSPLELRDVTGINARQLTALARSWRRLPADRYLLDAGRYRFRRHSCFVMARPFDRIEAVPHRAHWQPRTYNALHGGLTRWFEPLERDVANSDALAALVGGLGKLFAGVKRVRRWHIEAHQFRIDPHNGIGRPTPEGAHRDGVNFVAIVMLGRKGVRGGETRVFDARGATGVRFTMKQRGAVLLLDDSRVIHETTPIQPLMARKPAFRDTLVLTYRARGFLAPRTRKYRQSPGLKMRHP